MLDSIKADGAQPQRLSDPRLHLLEAEHLQQPQHLDPFPSPRFAQPRLQQSAEHQEGIGQLPAGERGRLVQRADLALEQRQIVQRLEQHVLALVGPAVPGDYRRAATDHHLLDVAADQDLAVTIGDRHRVVVAAVAHQ
ncbi:hypothetical protein H7965_24420 [Siccirubricoccus deserti]|uniref:Uncharacterized protein n=1 Tax=Siccirubricoccus deserti TaxID=2013562 RepID=A0A9X0R4J5_9PROT|nr:hypothetical protein [Siccirubricoccus deserti]